MGIKIMIELAEDATIRDLDDLGIEFDDLENKHCIKDIKVTEDVVYKNINELKIENGNLIPHYCSLCDIRLRVGHYRFNHHSHNYACKECIEKQRKRK